MARLESSTTWRLDVSWVGMGGIILQGRGVRWRPHPGRLARRRPLTYPLRVPPLVAYFSMEYGLHEEFHSYSGGLGVLAGDFMKSAGDLGLSVVGIGLRWGQGYTSQHIGADGYPHDEWADQKPDVLRSEEHTSELQSRLQLVCRLLLEKKKKK